MIQRKASSMQAPWRSAAAETGVTMPVISTRITLQSSRGPIFGNRSATIVCRLSMRGVLCRWGWGGGVGRLAIYRLRRSTSQKDTHSEAVPRTMVRSKQKKRRQHLWWESGVTDQSSPLHQEFLVLFSRVYLVLLISK
jgi:hypothetical protein